MRVNLEPYKPDTQEVFWCHQCDHQKVDSNDESTGQYFIQFGRGYNSRTKSYDGDYTGVMFALCCNCLENAANYLIGDSIMPTLTTSLAEIRSYKPCASGWRDILTARKPQSDDDYNIQFPLADCLESNTISDVCWLIGKRRKEEIRICVRFARMCADSVKNLNNYWSRKAADAAYDAADAANAAAAAANAAAAAAAANAAADAAYDAADVYEKQKQLNKQFLIQCINEFNQE